ncbi:MAG TPA: GMC oxidoreductase, partial [Blastocatellia bacterium]|nr:GMC oxidoreductase [Blastocatellia bacterium]
NDLVGRRLGGHITAGAIGYLKDLIGKDTFAGDGATDHAYIPRFNQARGQSHGKRDYVGGWGMQMNYVTWQWPHHAKSVEGFGSAYKKRVRELQPAMFQIGAWGKVEHRVENRVTVDPKKVDKFGIPIPIVQFNWGENDLKLFRDMRESVMEALDACGVETVINRDERPGGFASHEVGTCGMGKDPKTSVLNAYCQSHEIKNLFVVDGSCFTTFSEKNPTLTIAALAVRSARHIAELRRRGEL